MAGATAARSEQEKQATAEGKLPHVSWERIVEHIDHAVKLVGPDHVGLGSDFDGASMPDGMEDVTHLPQIATFADHHYVIEKKESAGRTRTSIRPVTGNERTEEVARMLSGAKLTETSRKHAEQMIKANG